MEGVAKKTVQENSVKLFLALLLIGIVLLTLTLLAPLVFLYSISPLLAVSFGIFLTALFAFGYVFLEKKNGYTIPSKSNKIENAELLTLSLSIFYQYLTAAIFFQALISYTGLESFFLVSTLYLALIVSFFTFVFHNKVFLLFVFVLSLIFASKEERKSGDPVKRIQYLLKTPL